MITVGTGHITRVYNPSPVRSLTSRCSDGPASYLPSVMYRSLDNILPHFKPNDDTEPGDIFFDVCFYSHFCNCLLITTVQPNVLSEGGTVSLTHFEISRSGELLGYGLSQSVYPLF